VIAKTMFHLAFAKDGSASPKTMRKPSAEGARFRASRTKAYSILNVSDKLRFSCQPWRLQRGDDGLRPVALGEFLS